MARWMRFSIGVLLALVLWAVGIAVASAGNSFVRADLRTDLSDIYGARWYRAWLSATAIPTTGDPADFATTYILVFLAQYNGQPGSGQLTQVGLKAQRDGVRWFVYAEPGVTCRRGQQTDWQHCHGNVGDLGVAINYWTEVELQKDTSNHWSAWVYDQSGIGYKVADINYTSPRIYLARMDTEEGYYEATDPFITVGYYHWHPQYLSGTYQDWPASSGPNCNWMDAYPSSVCPAHYGANPNLDSDVRYWWAGTGGKWCAVDPFFPAATRYLPEVRGNNGGWNSQVAVRNNGATMAHV
ncbi:MAG: hypothetical protein ACUVWR_12625 [Anaerolineae bacterium]